MHAAMCVAPFASLPISTPQTSVLLLERACCRICRTTSLLMRTEGMASFFWLDITQPLSLARQAPLPCRRQVNTQFRVPHCVPRKYRNPANQAYPASERRRIRSPYNRGQSRPRASAHHEDNGHLRTEPLRQVRTVPVVPHKRSTPACESRRG